MNNKRIAGFTLVELIVTLAIIALSMTFAVPGFQGMFARNRVVSQVNDLVLATNLARSEALRRGAIVSILAEDATDTDNEFGLGYCVYVGAAVYGTDSCADTGGEVLRNFPALAADATLNSVENDDVISFNGLGGVTDEVVKNIDLCYPGQDGRRIYISLIGRSRSHRPDDADTAKQPSC